jgi:transposase
MTGQLSVEEKINFLLKRVDYLEKEVVDLRDENRGLKSQVCQLTDRLAKYENPKNSKNSSKPPSSDFPKFPKTQSLRESSGKKPGGQFGHDGTTLKMVTSPDIIETHCPSFCTCCGEDLSTIPAMFIGKRQVINIPPIQPIVTEHQIFNKSCKCGQLNQASFPLGVNAPVSYGENVQAMIAYLSARQYLPVNRLAELLSDLFGLSVSTGGIDHILTKMKSKASVAYESIRQNVLKNKVIGADETGVSINGKNHWAWTFQHKYATFIAVHKNRSFKAIKEIMPEGLRNNTLVTDCWAAYFKTGAEGHQLCTAHLSRELIYHKQKHPDETWSGRMSKLITKALNLRRDNKATKFNVGEILATFSALIIEPLNKELKEVVAFQKRMVKHSDHLFNFLLNKDIPPDNNGSERAIRNFKVKQKISGFFKSVEGADIYATLRSVIDTAIKNEQNPYQIMRLIAKCEVATE